jgi:hypothetical protein
MRSAQVINLTQALRSLFAVIAATETVVFAAAAAADP